MSNRPAHHRQETSSRGYRRKTPKTYVPRKPNSIAPAEPLPNTNPTLSASLRGQSDAATASTGGGAATAQGSRIQLGANGDWVSNRGGHQSQGGGNFVNYLPQDEAVAVGLGADEGGLDPMESQRVVDLLNRELARLLKSKPRDFWREVAADTSLHEFLDSFLQFRSRWYDFPYHGAKGVVAGVIVGDLELSRHVLMVLYRFSSNREPGVRASDSLSQRDHGVILQEKKLLDLPKLLDICAVYGHENEHLTRSLVLNGINAQPDIHGSFTAMMSHFLGIAHTMYQRCTSSLEALISAGGSEDHGASQRHVEYLEVMDFLNDAVVSMDTFVSAYKAAAIFFSCPVDASHGNEELINILATLHDLLLPSLQQGFQIILAAGGKTSPMLSDVSVSLRILSARIVDLGWKLLDNCYLSDELFKDNVPLPAAMKMFPANVDDPVIRADILAQTFKEVTAVPEHAQGKNYRGTFLQNIENKYQIMHRIQSLQNSGWLLLDDEQRQYLTGMLTHPMAAISKKLPAAPTSARGDGQLMEEDAAIVESRISQVKDLFPDYGKGFISACLEVYDHNPEEVIQRILDGTLHEDLRTVDASMDKVPPKSTPSPTMKDKGKGKLVEDSTSIGTSLPQPRSEAITSSSSSLEPAVGRFIRKLRGDQPDISIMESSGGKHLEKTAALLSQYEYEDEYDDSFDDLGMTIMESGVEETEILGERISSSMSISSRAESHGPASSAPISKWNSKKKPQFYVKDGKNYSYKVEGSVAVADQKQASLVTQAQKELIYGLGRGGNLPLGAVMKLEEQNDEGDEADPSEVDSNAGRGRGRGRGRGGGRRSSHYRKDRSMRKHMAGLGGY